MREVAWRAVLVERTTPAQQTRIAAFAAGASPPVVELDTLASDESRQR
jgi:hypothetical protein